MQLIKLTKIS